MPLSLSQDSQANPRLSHIEDDTVLAISPSPASSKPQVNNAVTKAKHMLAEMEGGDWIGMMYVVERSQSRRRLLF